MPNWKARRSECPASREIGPEAPSAVQAATPRLRPPRMTPTHRVEHVMENCPDCGAHLSGGWTHRTREVSSCPSHRAHLRARTCPACRRRCTPPAELDSVVLGQQAPSTAQPDRKKQVPGNRVSCASAWGPQRHAHRAQPSGRDPVRASPVVHADEMTCGLSAPPPTRG